jgi:hypothetical protein
MKSNIRRREAITKPAVVAGTLLAFKGVAAPTIRKMSFAGSWFYQGQPCAIFQEGSILLAVNEVGSLATAQITSPNTFTIWGGSGWDSGLIAEMAIGGRAINWSNGTVWTRAQL